MAQLSEVGGCAEEKCTNRVLRNPSHFAIGKIWLFVSVVSGQENQAALRRRAALPRRRRTLARRVGVLPFRREPQQLKRVCRAVGRVLLSPITIRALRVGALVPFLLAISPFYSFLGVNSWQRRHLHYITPDGCSHRSRLLQPLALCASLPIRPHQFLEVARNPRKSSLPSTTSDEHLHCHLPQRQDPPLGLRRRSERSGPQRRRMTRSSRHSFCQVGASSPPPG